MTGIDNTILVLSGKGGVGKTTIAVNLALSLALSGKTTGILDADIHGPNVPKMLGLDGRRVKHEGGILPVIHSSGLKAMSLGFLIDDKDSVIWRGPMKHNLIKQFTNDVIWGQLDYLVVDFPPGTGDEQISTAQLVGKPSCAVIVATPQKVALLDSVRSIDFCRKMGIPLCGILENMSGQIFGRGTVMAVAQNNSIPYLGSLQMKKEIAESGDSGVPFITSNPKAFIGIQEQILRFCKETMRTPPQSENRAA